MIGGSSGATTAKVNFYIGGNIFRNLQVIVTKTHVSDHDLVDTKICYESESVVGAGVYRMCVRAFLALGVCTGAGVLDGGCGFGEAAVFINWDHACAAAAVVCDEDVFSFGIYADVTGARTAGGLLV